MAPWRIWLPRQSLWVVRQRANVEVEQCEPGRFTRFELWIFVAKYFLIQFLYEALGFFATDWGIRVRSLP